MLLLAILLLPQPTSNAFKSPSKHKLEVLKNMCRVRHLNYLGSKHILLKRLVLHLLKN